MTTIVCAPWTTASAANDCSNCADVNPELLTQKIAVASDLLNELVGGRFPGLCTESVRPCARQLSDDAYGSGITTRSGSDGNTIALSNGCGCNSPRSCGCTRLAEITLGGYPVVSITEVLIDGQIVDDLTYRIDDSRYLVRLPNADGTNDGWPCCQDLSLDTTEDNTFEVTFTYGAAPPQAGVDAAGVLACELALACSGGGETCRLPHSVRSQVRQGVATEYINVLDFLSEGRTGLMEVDLFLEAFGPKRKARMPAQMVNPDIHMPVRRTSAVPPS